MNKSRFLGILTLVFFPFVLHSQTYTVSSSTSAKNQVKMVGDNNWRPIKRSDLNTLSLSESDSIKVVQGSLAIRSIQDLNRSQYAFPGTWSVKQIWRAEAKRAKPNCEPIGGSEKGETPPLSVDVATVDGFVGDSLRIGNQLSSLVISNHGDTEIYVAILWIEEFGGELVAIPRLGTSSRLVKPGLVTEFPFAGPIAVEPPSGEATVAVMYSTHPFGFPNFPDNLTSVREVGRFLHSCGLSCATKVVVFDY